MIEPSIGILRLSTSDDFDDTEETVTVLSIGAGLLFLSSAGDQDHVYFGPRIGIVQVSSSYSEPGFSDDDSNTSVKIGGAIGGQFFLRQRFSLGAEVGLSWWNVDFPGTDLGLLSTNAELRARWYFR